MKKVCFCGISGSGMCALAQLLKYQGVDVSGSYRSFDQGKDAENKAKLENFGIRIFPQDGSAIQSDTDCLYVSTAVEDTIADVKKAKELGISIKKRSDLLAEIFNASKYGIAVGGTSGKTTVTSMIGFVLDKLGYNPLMINGGLLKNYEDKNFIPNVILNENSDICVVEADESDGSIEKYVPYIAVVNNITIDHKTIPELQELFSNFVSKAIKGAVVNLDCQNSKALYGKHQNLVTFSAKDKNADVFVSDIIPIKNGVQYCLDNKKYYLNLIGKFNVLNAACTMAALKLLGIDMHETALALQEFLSTKRRLDVIGIKNNVTVIDDFAHNPDKVAASMSALRDYEGRLLVMFQPHGFSPMRMMGREIMQSFAKYMQSDDMLFVPEIFYAGGSVKKDISSLDLVNYAKTLGVNAEFYQTRDEIKDKIVKLAKAGDRVVIMGARDNSLPIFCKNILSEV